MKILHSSDWHIGRQFHNHSLLEDQAHVLKQIVDYVRTQDVDALVIAGDIYDRSVPPATAVSLLDDVLNQICNQLQIPVVLIPGNHDSADRLNFGARQLKQAGLYIMGELTKINEPLQLVGKSGIKTNFYGIPYNDPEQIRNLFDCKVSSYDEAHDYLVQIIKQSMIPDQINVLISHCFIDGSDSSESERPLSIGGADTVSYEPLTEFNYVALGHLHGPQFRGREHIRYSGSILKYSFSEQHHNKVVNLVEFNSSGVATIKALPLTPLRNMRILEGEMDSLIEQGKTDPHNQDYLMVRLTDTHAILNAMSQLREVYPNVLHLEKPGIMASGEQKMMSREQLKRSEIEIFRDFFRQVSNNVLTRDQDAALEEVLSSLHKKDQNS